MQPKHELRDVSRAEEMEAERRIALALHYEFPNREARAAAWVEKTGKSEKALYRRFRELKQEGKLEPRE